MVVEFLVEEAAQRQPATVTGRVMTGVIRVGDVFTEAVADGVRSVSLVVLEDRRYGDVLVDEVETVHAAELLLTGSGWDAVQTGVTLRHYGYAVPEASATSRVSPRGRSRVRFRQDL